jgi:hypothetical protein
VRTHRRVPWSEGNPTPQPHPSWRPAPYRDASSLSRSVSPIEPRSVSLTVSLTTERDQNTGAHIARGEARSAERKARRVGGAGELDPEPPRRRASGWPSTPRPSQASGGRQRLRARRDEHLPDRRPCMVAEPRMTACCVSVHGRGGESAGHGVCGGGVGGGWSSGLSAKVELRRFSPDREGDR